MKTTRSHIVAQCASLVFAVVSLAACAADWPQWGGLDVRNMVGEEKGLPVSFVPGKKSPQGAGIDFSTTRNVKWIARLGTQTYGNPVVANGKVLLGTNDEAIHDPRVRSTRGGLVMCLDEATGKLLWQLIVPRFETNLPEFNFDDMGLGICSSPTVDGDRVYLVTSRCEVLCLDLHGMANGNDGPYTDEGQYIAGPGHPPVKVQPTDADIIWRYDMIAELKSWPQDASNCSVLVHGDLVYACTSNGVDRSHIRVPSPLTPSLIALDKRTGRLVAADNEKIGTRLFHGQWSSPSLGVVHGKPQIYFGGGDGVVYAFEPFVAEPGKPAFLKKIWSFDCNPPEYKSFGGKKLEYTAGDVRKHTANTNDGTFLGPSEVIATPVLYKDRVYIATGQDPCHGRGRGILNCIDATKTGDVTKTGKIWSYDKIGRSLSTVAISDGLLYVADTFEGLHCLDAETGERYWFHPTNSEVWGSAFVADGKVFLGSKKSLVVMEPGRKDKVLAEMHLGTPIYSTPIVANGVMYVASQHYLWAVQKEGKGASEGEAGKMTKAQGPMTND